MRTIILPKVDMLTVSKSSRNQRKSIRDFAPRIGLTVVDHGRLDEIDSFYTDCQNFRDYYRDPYNKLPRPVPFKRHWGKCSGLRFGDKLTNLLMMPSTWVVEKQPVLYPLPVDKSMYLGQKITLGGTYNAQSCVKYKR